MKRRRIRLHADTVRVLTDLRAVVGGVVKPTNTSGVGCDCWPDPLPPA